MNIRIYLTLFILAFFLNSCTQKYIEMSDFSQSLKSPEDMRHLLGKKRAEVEHSASASPIRDQSAFAALMSSEGFYNHDCLTCTYKESEYRGNSLFRIDKLRESKANLIKKFNTEESARKIEPYLFQAFDYLEESGYIKDYKKYQRKYPFSTVVMLENSDKQFFFDENEVCRKIISYFRG